MKKIDVAIAEVRETRRKALIQFQPGIEEARTELHQKNFMNLAGKKSYSNCGSYFLDLLGFFTEHKYILPMQNNLTSRIRRRTNAGIFLAL
ncbi:hypothetical protein GCM10020331_001730 [Ectobacillus funiculus]